MKRSFLVDQELYKNLEIVNNSCTVKFILRYCQNLSCDTVMDWYSNINIIS